MRLINVESLVLEEFISVDGDVPKYAILSHTWGASEVTFQDFTNPDKTIRSGKTGFSKIQATCDLAAKAGLSHVWVDTCCIDKTSSAELTEAINSMFRWYRAAEVCYAWLADLPTDTDGRVLTHQLGKCRWFTRGWTLQELLAPRRVEFYDESWIFRGTKEDLMAQLSEITKINTDILKDPDQLFRLPVAQKMSWAATRQTTRVEDMAYCLLGIFNVTMPMLYGEGSGAFQRLQEEISKETNDLSLFAWQSEPSDQLFHGIFAHSPRDFRASASVQLVQNLSLLPEYRISNKGVNLATSIQEAHSGKWLLPLNCSHDIRGNGTKKEVLGIWLKPHGGERYSRVKIDELGSLRTDEIARPHHVKMYLVKRMTAAESKSLQGGHEGAIMMRAGFNEMAKLRYPDFPFESFSVAPRSDWEAQKSMILTHGKADYSVTVSFRTRPDKMAELGLGPHGMFTVAVGKLEDDEKPFVMLVKNAASHGIYNAITQKLNGEKVRELLPKSQTLTLKRFMKEGGTTLTVSMVEDVVDGQKVFCVDLACRDAKDSEVNPKDT